MPNGNRRQDCRGDGTAGSPAAYTERKNGPAGRRPKAFADRREPKRSPRCSATEAGADAAAHRRTAAAARPTVSDARLQDVSHQLVTGYFGGQVGMTETPVAHLKLSPRLQAAVVITAL